MTRRPIVRRVPGPPPPHLHARGTALALALLGGAAAGAALIASFAAPLSPLVESLGAAALVGLGGAAGLLALESEEPGGR